MLRKGRGFVEKNWITRPEDAKGSWEEVNNLRLVESHGVSIFHCMRKEEILPR